jgi:hypothetical protein
VVPQIFVGQSHDTSQPIKPVRLMAREFAAATAALQASGRKVECGSQLLKGQTGSSHEFLYDNRRESFSNGVAQVPVGG